MGFCGLLIKSWFSAIFVYTLDDDNRLRTAFGYYRRMERLVDFEDSIETRYLTAVKTFLKFRIQLAKILWESGRCKDAHIARN